MSIIVALALAAASDSGNVPGMQPVPGVASLLQSGIPAIPAELKERVGQYLNARGASLLDVSDDGGALLIATRFASTSQLHVVEQPLGMRTQITFGDEPISTARFAPGDPQTLWYLRDAGGGEFYQLFRLDRRSFRRKTGRAPSSSPIGGAISTSSTSSPTAQGRSFSPRKSSRTSKASPSPPTARALPSPSTKMASASSTSSTRAPDACSRSSCRGPR